MDKMKEIKITTAKMKGLHDGLASCPEAQNAIRNAFPEAFEEEWIDITKKVKFLPDSRQAKGYYWLAMHYEDEISHFGYVDSDGVTINDKDEYRVEVGTGENGGMNFRILKKS